MSERHEFVALAVTGQLAMTELCRRFKIAPKTGYLWLKRYRAGEPMTDRSRRPLSSPRRTPAAVEQKVVAVRQKHATWGGRKISRRLEDQGELKVPSPSTVTAILQRHGLMDPRQSLQHQPWQRFEHPHPNDMWQMDFKGHFALSDGSRCHTLTVLDDHSRYSLAVRACGNERDTTVRWELTKVFECYGLPWKILCDNGPPWGVPYVGPRALGLTQLGVWLIRLGVGITHGRGGHPQTQGKEERFHRTLKQELIDRQPMHDMNDAQQRFDPFRHCYNHERPHEALGLDTPARHYTPSLRCMPRVLPPVEYAEGEVRKVGADGKLSWRGRQMRVTKALAGLAVALRPTMTDGLWDVMFCGQRVGQLDEREKEWRICSVKAAEGQVNAVLER